MGQLDEIAELFRNIDEGTDLTQRLEAISKWLETRPGVSSAQIVCKDQVSLGAADGVVPRIPAAKISLLPREIAIINGKSPIPRHLFPESQSMPVTVYAPFTDRSGDPLGAILVKATSPKTFVRKHDAELQILASKTRDAVDIASLRAVGPTARGGGELTPIVIGKLMDLVKLPAYVLSTNGEFLFVNDRFLEQFEYADLEELNTRPEVFIRQEDWADQLRRLTSESGFTPLTTKIRTGSDRVRSVYDFSLLMGKDILGVLVDVSDFVQMNEQLQDALEGQTRLNEQLSSATSMLQKTQATAMKSLAKLAEYRDKETGGHLQRICEYMKLVAIELHKEQPYSFHVANDYADDIYLSGMLHDIGKVGVPDQILLKPGPLASDEWHIMQKHTTWGYSILNQADHELGEQSFLTLASRIALHHHEWYNGEGYPHGLSREAIPLSARIGAVADVYDALTSRRPYKEAWNHDQAVTEIHKLREKQFDPVITDIFFRLEERFREVRSRFPDEPAMN
jgi:HD-GYP domain-containing protein (c-di-GMP phosphodiesterase class II)